MDPIKPERNGVKPLARREKPDFSRARAESIAKERLANGKDEMWKHVIDFGWQEVEPGVHLFYVRWGKKGGVPFMMLHGGPGHMFNDTHFALMDATVHDVVAFDQRGSGASYPLASEMTKEWAQDVGNPLHVVRDTEHMRQTFFSGKKIHVAGGSWGSTAALLYAEEHPDQVASLQLWSGFIGSRAEVENMLADPTGKKDFPYRREYQWFISHIPPEGRGDVISFLY
ncbi:MAG: alpha/beta fold hydrolase, partial [Patescibacteria group bacterium]